MIAHNLTDSVGAGLHGDMSQRDRETVMGDFRNGIHRVLFATDVAARGLDVPDVDLVVHYRFPQTHEAYVHRSGRCGRAGRSGASCNRSRY